MVKAKEMGKNNIALLKKVFKGKRVVITGHTGFKGSWLSIWLKELGAVVMGYALAPPTIPNNFEVTKLSKRITHVHGDIRDFSFLKKVFNEFQPEFVFHLAAQSLVRRSYEESRTTFETNVMGTVNVCEAIKDTASSHVLINVTSDKCYENKEWLWGYRETDHLGGHDPYSSSKACAELVSQSYIRAFFAPKGNIGVASVRAGNVIGGGDWGSDRLIPDCVRALTNKKPISLRYPEAIRPWQFILEPLYGYLLLAAKLFENPGNYSGAWNFGPDSNCCISVGKVAEKVINHWGFGKWKKVSGRMDNKKHEMNLLKLNCDKAHSLLKWHGALDIDEAIKMTLEWYKTFYQSPAIDMYTHCATQIKEYVQIVSEFQPDYSGYNQRG